jgi:Ca-activated chloride channel family protein
MSFEWPIALLALAVVPAVLIAYLIIQRRPSRYTLAFPNLDVLAAVVGRSSSWRRWIAPVLFLLALAAATAALARPHLDTRVKREQATIVLAIDESGSMYAQDVQPYRLAAAQAAASHFLDKLPPKFRVGLVSFSGSAQVAAPVTRNRQLVRDALSYLSPQRGTAIGDAVARAAQLGRDAVGFGPARRLAADTSCKTDTKTKEPVAVLFLSDGFQTSGQLSPQDGAARARQLCVPVYTIALGTDQGVLDFGGREIPVPPDRQTLSYIAQATGGKYFAAPSSGALDSAYSSIGSLLATEPSKTEITWAFVLAAAILAVLAAAASLVTTSRIP